MTRSKLMSRSLAWRRCTHILQQTPRLFHGRGGWGRSRPIRAVPDAPGGIDPKLGDQPVPLQRLGPVGPHPRDHDQIPIGLHAGRHGPFHLKRIADFDVVVDHGHLLDQIDRAPDRKHGLARIARPGLAEADHGMEPAGAAEADGDAMQAGDTAAEMAGEAGRNRDAADQHMLGMVARLDRLIDRIATPGHSLEGDHLALAIGLVEPVEFRDRPLLDELAGVEGAFQHDLAMSRHRKRAGPTAHHLDGLAQQGACDLQLVIAQSQIKRGRRQHRRVIADGDGDGQGLPPASRRPGELGQMMVWRDADEGAIAPQRFQPGEGKVARFADAVLGDDGAGGDIGPALAFEEMGYGQRREIRRFDLDLLAGTGLDEA